MKKISVKCKIQIPKGNVAYGFGLIHSNSFIHSECFVLCWFWFPKLLFGGMQNEKNTLIFRQIHVWHVVSSVAPK